MRIINLMENTEGKHGCAAAHGLSFYIETDHHKLLMDLGPSEETLKNAEKLGIDLTAVDTVILSHGHYDHSGGILAFAQINPNAVIYMQESAGEDYYSLEETEEGTNCRYIGIDKEIRDLPQVKRIKGDFVIDDELSLFTIDERICDVPFSNRRLKQKKGDDLVQDDFAHEQCLVICDGDRRILFSGCAHNGILNILAEYQRKYGGQPDAVISGFHLMKKGKYTEDEIKEILSIARELKKYRTLFYTCHCTSLPAFDIMKLVLDDQLRYVHSGDEIKSFDAPAAPKKKGKNSFMKFHKFFAWATVFCFIMTMVTGYKRK